MNFMINKNNATKIMVISMLVASSGLNAASRGIRALTSSLARMAVTPSARSLAPIIFEAGASRPYNTGAFFAAAAPIAGQTTQVFMADHGQKLKEAMNASKQAFEHYAKIINTLNHDSLSQTHAVAISREAVRKELYPACKASIQKGFALIELVCKIMHYGHATSMRSPAWLIAQLHEIRTALMYAHEKCANDLKSIAPQLKAAQEQYDQLAPGDEKWRVATREHNLQLIELACNQMLAATQKGVDKIDACLQDIKNKESL